MREKLYQTTLPSFDEGPEKKAEVGLRYSQRIPKRTANLIYVLSNSSHVDPLSRLTIPELNSTEGRTAC